MSDSAHAPPRLPTPWMAIGLLVTAVLLAYANTFQAPLVYDDIQAIAENPTIRTLWPAWKALQPPAGGLTVSGRPGLNLSFAVSHALGGGAVWAHHAVNVLIHAGAVLLLLGIVRRTFRLRSGPALRLDPGQTSYAERTSGGPTEIAFTVAALWALHPLQTQAVTYTVQRAESLMGFWYFLTLYCFVRSVDCHVLRDKLPVIIGGQEGVCHVIRDNGNGRRAWSVVSVFACALGMGTKEVMATAPLLVLLYDRTFVAGSLGAAWTARRGYYVGLAATWLVLAALVLGTGGNRGGTVGLGVGVPLWAYPLTQFHAVVRYLGLTAWPQPLVFEYGTQWVREATDILPYLVVVLPLLVATVIALRRWPAMGFAGAWFFLILAPTSLAPGTIQMVVEHRVYLSLAAAMALAVLALHACLGRCAPPAVAAIAIGFAVLTFSRNADYRSHLALWSDTVAKRPENPRAHVGLAEALAENHQIDAAARAYAEAVRLDPGESRNHYNLAMTVARAGRWPEAVDHYQKALRLTPTEARTHNNLAIALGKLGRNDDALRHYVEAERLDPRESQYSFNHGVALMRLGRVAEATARYEAALRLTPDHTDAHRNLGAALFSLGRHAEALEHYARAVQLAPEDLETRANHGSALVVARKLNEALEQFRFVLARDANHVAARFGRANALAAQRQYEAAIAEYEHVLRVAPEQANAHFKLGDALLDAGRLAPAIEHYAAAVRLAPEDAEAHHNLGVAYARLERWAEAEREFEAALRLKPDYADARKHLEQLRRVLGK